MTDNTLNEHMKRHARSIEFYKLAFGDYLAARTLLLNDLLEQGIGLAATAVEKIFKSILAIRGENPNGHITKALLKSIKNYKPDLYKQLREDFLEFLAKAYDLRYLDNLKQGHSLVINKYRCLAETDKTMCIILSGIYLNHTKLPFEEAKESHNKLLLRENYYLKDGNTLRYQEKINLVHEIKVFGDYDSIFASYETHGVSNSGSFLKPVNLVKTSNQIHGKLSLG